MLRAASPGRCCSPPPAPRPCARGARASDRGGTCVTSAIEHPAVLLAATRRARRRWSSSSRRKMAGSETTRSRRRWARAAYPVFAEVGQQRDRGAAAGAEVLARPGAARGVQLRGCGAGPGRLPAASRWTRWPTPRTSSAGRQGWACSSSAAGSRSSRWSRGTRRGDGAAAPPRSSSARRRRWRSSSPRRPGRPRGHALRPCATGSSARCCGGRASGCTAPARHGWGTRATCASRGWTPRRCSSPWTWRGSRCRWVQRAPRGRCVPRRSSWRWASRRRTRGARSASRSGRRPARPT